MAAKETVFIWQQNFDVRKTHFARVANVYPDKILAIARKMSDAKLPQLDSYKFIVPGDLTVGQFIYKLRQRLTLKDMEALFVYVDTGSEPTCNKLELCLQSELMSQLYARAKQPDGGLYFVYREEDTFG